MALTKDEVLNVAKLARLQFAEDEIDEIQNDLNNILNYIDILNEVNTDNIEPLAQINNDENNLRDDTVRASLSVEKVLLNAPESQDGAIIVPKVVVE